ncbi:hypothetical protein BV20DRAFT_956341 [Pilatotrama ljubarskyi]|nr:hypothetical protein BV20DRAFT_956341 [Pilatotrama ljubarskyi]
MSLSLFWDRDGKSAELPPYPDSFQHWQAGEPLDDSTRAILEEIEQALSLKITQTDLRSANNNLVLEIELENGRRNIARTCNPDPEVSARDTAATTRPAREAELLRWLKANATIPVPEIRCVIEPTRPGIWPIVVMEKMPGNVVLNDFGKAPYSVKLRNMHAFADLQIALFRLNVPQRIGTARCAGGTINVVPWCASEPNIDTLEGYIASLLDKKRRTLASETDPSEDAKANATRTLNRIAAELSSICSRLTSPAHRRCVLRHDDLGATNVLMGPDGDITGVVDWDFQSVVPAVLAVEYPQWIRYDGTFSPKYMAAPAGGMEVWWFVSPQDAARLREEYAKILQEKDRECWDALVDGERLRQLVEWLFSGDDYAAMEGWLDKVYTQA